jgi:hypothetical protein
MKKIILIQSLIFFAWNCFSHSCDSIYFTVEKNSIQYGIETKNDNYKCFYSLLYTVHNIDNDIVWLWLENETYSSDNEKNKRYFFNNNKGISFFHLLTDANVIVTDFCPILFETFLKPIESNKSFTLQIFSDEPISYQKKEDIFEYLDKHIVIEPNEQFTKFLGIKDFIDKEKVKLYKEDFITLPLSVVVDSVCNGSVW